MAIDELQTRRLTEAQELEVDEAVLDVVKQVDVLDDLMTFALDESLNKGWGPEWDDPLSGRVLLKIPRERRWREKVGFIENTAMRHRWGEGK